MHSYMRFKKRCRSMPRMADESLSLVNWRRVLGPKFSPFVFPSPRNATVHFVDYKTAWRTAAKKAGLADRRISDLRATFASRANVCHATGLTVAHLLGQCQHPDPADLCPARRREHQGIDRSHGYRPQRACDAAAFHQLIRPLLVRI